MKRSSLFLLLIFALCFILGQDGVLRDMSEDEVRAFFVELQEMESMDARELEPQLSHAIGCAQQLDLPEMAAKGHHMAADLYLERGAGLKEMRVAVNHYLRAIKVYEDMGGNSEGKAKAHFGAAQGFRRFGDHHEAISNLLKALALFELVGDSASALRCNLQLGEVFFLSGSYEEAIMYCQKAGTMGMDLGQDSIVMASLMLRGQIHENQGAMGLAIMYYNEALDKARRLNNQPALTRLLNLQAGANFENGDLQRGEEQYEEALALSKSLGLPRTEASSYHGLAKIALEREDYSRAEELLGQCLALVEDHEIVGMDLPVYKSLAELSLQREDIQEFKSYQEKIRLLTDSLEASARQELIQRLGAQFEKERQEMEIQRMEQREALATEEIEKQRSRNTFAIVIGLLLLILALVLGQLYRAKRRINQRLESTVNRRTEELRYANTALQRANQELDTFAYRTAHDIRGPLARLLGLSQITLREVENPEILRYIQMIDREANNMDAMLRRFLEVNDIKHQTPKFETVSLIEVMNNALVDLKGMELKHKVDLEIKADPGLNVKTDPDLLDIVLRNMMENSIIFSQENARPFPYLRVNAELVEKHIEIRVTDNGIGIEPKAIPHIFEMFYRGTRHSVGLGLGLYAAKLAAQKIDAHISYCKENEDATEFLIKLPVREGS